MSSPILRITDGTTKVNLIKLKGWMLNSWSPSVPEPKGGGIFRSSPLADGRKLSYRKMDNIIDTFNLVGNEHSQDEMIESIQELERLLEKATAYWTSDWQNEPVWIEAKSSDEMNVRYATIVDYRFTGFGGPYSQPFFSPNCNSATEAILAIEHKFWQETVPGEEGECVQLHNDTVYPHVDTFASSTYYPGGSAYDCTYSPSYPTVDLTNVNLGVGYANVLPGKNEAGIVFFNLAIDPTAVIHRATLTLHAGIISVGEADLIIMSQSQVGGTIYSVTITNPGQGYISPEVIVINSVDDEEGFREARITAKSFFQGHIHEINIIDGGAGYVTPTLIIRDKAGIGKGATATAVASPVNVDAVAFDGTVEDFIGRTRHSNVAVVHLEDGVYPSAITVTKLVQNVINSGYWTNGDNLGMFIQAQGDCGRQFHSFDEGVNYAELYIEYTKEVVPLGRETTCAQEVWVSNKHTDSNITHAFRYDASLAAFSSNLIGYDYTTVPLHLLPYDVALGIYPAVGDCFYAGSCNLGGIDTRAPFCSLVLDIYAHPVGIDTGVWEYYNGAWTAFGAENASSGMFPMCGRELMFMTVGGGSNIWEQPTDWTLGTINGVTGYWIRFRVLTKTGDPTPPYQWHRDIFTVITPYIDIDAEEVPGDTTALARIILGSAACVDRSYQNVTLGLRSLSRGENFSAYLNASEHQMYSDVVFTPSSSCDIHSDMRAPTGHSLHSHTFSSPTMDSLCKWSLTGDLAKEYMGTYRAYLRCRQDVVPNGNIKFRLRVEQSIANSYSETGTLVYGSGYITYVDLGQVSIQGSYTSLQGQDEYQVNIYLEAVNPDIWGFYVYDLILIPADEWSCSISSASQSDTPMFYYGNGFDLDAIRNPRKYRSSLMQNVYIDERWASKRYCELSRVASGEPVFQSSTDQRLWFFTYKEMPDPESFIENCGVIRAERSARYILMRGSR